MRVATHLSTDTSMLLIRIALTLLGIALAIKIGG
jgi:hypothetical protein